jgi:hypothetical protein
VHVSQVILVEQSSKSPTEVKREFLVVVIDCGVYCATGQSEKEKNKNLKGVILSCLTLLIKRFKSLFTMAFTTRPFTSASQIDIIVRTTRRAASNPIIWDS